MSFDTTQPVRSPPYAGSESFVFPSGPTNYVFVDAFESAEQPRRIEAPIVVDPPPQDWIYKPCEIS